MAQNQYCEVCDLNLDPTSFASHMSGKKHQRLSHLLRRDMRIADCEILVTNFPPLCTRDQIASFFQQYGIVINCQFQNKTTFLIRFRDPQTTQYLIKNNIYIHGRKLFFKKPNNEKPRAVERQKNLKKDKDEPNINPESSSILSVVKTNKSFDEQVDDLILLLQDPQNVQQKKCDAVLRDLSNALNALFPCELHKFGSTVTGLGLRNSDVDIYVNLLPHRPYNFQESMEFLKSTKRILSRSLSFHHVFGIFGAKTPIIKCEHFPTKLHCDINFKNSLGIHNSELIKYLQTLDGRVKKMMLVVKWWAKHLGLTGSSKITNYALTLMVIYFLQQKQILPTVEYLQKDCVESNDTEWNCSFNIELGRQFRITNEESLIALLSGFFKFYGDFDFTNVISPLTGINYSREAFAKIENVPEGFERYKEKLAASLRNCLKLDSSIVVMDPFELSHNVTPSTTDKMLEDLKQACIISFKCFEKKKDYKECEVLMKLFSTKLENKGRGKLKDYEISLTADTELAYQLQVAMKTNLDEVRNEWFNRTHELVMQVMKEILCLDVQTVTASPERKTARTEEAVEVHNQNVSESTKYRCVGFIPILRGRRKVKVVNRDLSFLDQQKAITQSMLAKTGTKPAKPVVDFFMTISNVMKPTKIVLKMTSNLSLNGEFTGIGDYCKKNLKKMMNRPLVPVAEQNATGNATKSGNIIKQSGKNSKKNANTTKQSGTTTIQSSNTTIQSGNIIKQSGKNSKKNANTTKQSGTTTIQSSNTTIQSGNTATLTGNTEIQTDNNIIQTSNAKDAVNEATTSVAKSPQKSMQKKKIKVRHDIEPPGFVF